jgi:hypothetical protein
MEANTDQVFKRGDYNSLSDKKAPLNRGASLVPHRKCYALVSTHCCASSFHACPTSQESEASLLWLLHPSARANEVERTKANSDAVRVFMALSFYLYFEYILKCFLIKIHSVTALCPIYVFS